MNKASPENKIELTWYEKKRGVKLATKKKKVEGKQQRKLRREQDKSTCATASTAKENTLEKKQYKQVPNKKNILSVKKVNALFNPTSIPEDAKKILLEFNSIVESSHPLNSKQKALLPSQIRSLCHTLTDERDERRLGYMNDTATLSAYVHYYLWWNLIRLTRLFSNLPKSFLDLKDNSICLDIGTGPLTVVIALFIARPDLRKLPLTWYCMDISSQAITIGEDIFLSIAAKLKCEPWKIVRVKGALGDTIKEKADFITCANVFNEVVQSSDMPTDFLAKKYASQILSYADKKSDNTKVLVIEPGVPSCARFISFLRDAFIRQEYKPFSPCPHTELEKCAMDGKKEGKWCNYMFTTEAAPKELKKLSDASHLAKERAVLTFIAVGKNAPAKNKFAFRIASDPIRLPGNRTGYYACSEKGLLLVVSKTPLKSGECYEAELTFDITKRIDSKSGAYVIEI